MKDIIWFIRFRLYIHIADVLYNRFKLLKPVPQLARNTTVRIGG